MPRRISYNVIKTIAAYMLPCNPQ